MNTRFIAVALSILAFPLAGADLPTGIQAKFIKIIGASGGANAVACKDSAMAGEIKTAGFAVDGASKVAYASSEGDIAAYKGKLIIVPKLEWLPKGGSIAIVEEGGKPAIYLHMGNIAASGVPLSDTILKIGKKL